MKRDWKLIKKILLALEDMETAGEVLRPDDIGGYPPEDVSCHIWLLDQAGLIEARCQGRPRKMYCLALRITWEGYELLERLRSETIWKAICKTAKDKGIGLSFEAIKAISLHCLKAAIN